MELIPEGAVAVTMGGMDAPTSITTTKMVVIIPVINVGDFRIVEAIVDVVLDVVTDVVDTSPGIMAKIGTMVSLGITGKIGKVFMTFLSFKYVITFTCYRSATKILSHTSIWYPQLA